LANAAPSNPSIAVVIPAYNVENQLDHVIKSLPSYIAHIIVVNDHSSDQTENIAKSFDNKKIMLISHKENQGVGGAMISGYEKAMKLDADVVIKIDGDGQMDPAYIPFLIKPILEGKADYCKGNRFLRPQYLVRMPFIRKIGNLGLSFLTKIASGYWNIFDPTNGYTAISTYVLELINPNKFAKRYFFESSMLLEMGLLKAVVKDISIPAKYGDEKSNLSEWKSLVDFPPRLIKGFFKRIIYRYFIQDFSAVSLFIFSSFILLCFGIFFGAYYWMQSAQTGNIASTGTVMISVLPIIIGIQLILQAIVLDIQNTPVNVLTPRNSSNSMKFPNPQL